MDELDDSGQRPASRQWRRRARTRTALLDATRELIAERGVDGFTLSDVTAAIGMSPGTLYNYFPTAEELTRTLIREDVDALGSQLDTVHLHLDDPAEVYAASLRLLVRHAVTDPLWGRFYVQLGVGHPLVTELLGPRARRDLRNGVHAGRLRVEDLDLAVAMTFGALSSVINLVNESRGPSNRASRYAAAMLRMVGLPPAEAWEVANRPLPAVTSDPTAPHGTA